MTELTFALSIEDGWPPVAAECLACTKLESGYRVEVAPLFISDLSVGDIIKVGETDSDQVMAWSHVERSNRTTAWLMVLDANYSIEDAIACLRRLQCNVERLEEYRFFSIDVPQECTIEEFDGCLNVFDGEKVAIAYPSFRH